MVPFRRRALCHLARQARFRRLLVGPHDSRWPFGQCGRLVRQLSVKASEETAIPDEGSAEPPTVSTEQGGRSRVAHRGLEGQPTAWVADISTRQQRRRDGWGGGAASMANDVAKLVEVFRRVEYANPFQSLVLGTGVLARQCGGSAVGSQGGSVILATAVSGREVVSGGDLLPLVVEYREKAHAFGRILLNRARREGSQDDREILVSRVVDRVIRPLFPYGYAFDTQVVATVESADEVNDLATLAVNTVSTALALSDIPWDGPVGCVRVGMVDGKLVVNPTEAQMKESALDLLYAGNDRNTLMIEAGAHKLSEAEMERALKYAHFQCKSVIEAQRELAKQAGKPKRVPAPTLPTPEMRSHATEVGHAKAMELFADVSLSKERRSVAEGKLQQEIRWSVEEAFPDSTELARGICADEVLKLGFRDAAYSKQMRCDGRRFTELRRISAAANVLPSTHGSAVFSRGDTQVLCAVTLGSDDDAVMPRFRDKNTVGKKAFLHYDFPPYSVNETGKVFGTNRRMVGHGALAERAILPVLPSADQFPYTIRITSEVTSSNGSSSMASACGASLALMDAGVPITAAVAGVSVGLVTPLGEHAAAEPGHQVLVDILGLEDHYGDMDFKIAGTDDGITAMQLDVKLQGGIPLDILCEGLRTSTHARRQILAVMSRTMRSPRPALKPAAPRMEVVRYSYDEHKDLFTLENRRLIEDEYDVTLSFPEEGKVTIFGRTPEKVAKAHQHVTELVSEVNEGDVYTATVLEVKDYGAVVEVLRGKRGLLHMSEISHKLAKPVHELIAVGQSLSVKCLQVDKVRGMIKVSRKALLNQDEPDVLRPDARGAQAAAAKLPPPPPGAMYTHHELSRGERRREVEGGGENDAVADEESLMSRDDLDLDTWMKDPIDNRRRRR